MTRVPARDCALCPRLAAFREQNQVAYPDFFNAPVPSFGGSDAELLIVGLAPGLKGANRTGRPFTGDYAGELLYATLDEFGFSTGAFGARPDDGLSLHNCRITNAVRCVPPENKPSSAEVRECGRFLRDELEALPRLRIVLALGALAHGAVLSALDLRPSRYRFAHGAFHCLPDERSLADSYHCSRYNTNTGRLTADMFRAVFREIAARLGR
ncbi:MAG: uracil-DNA glycosylase [Alphaproteobacteria bacterium]